MFGLKLKNKNNNKSVNSQSERGFTLIESLVAITILLIAITGPLVLAKQGVISSRLAKNQITAFYLAQDVIEFVRNKRDSNFLGGGNWLSGLDDCIGSGNKCEIDTTSNTISSCGPTCPLLRESSEGLYGYNLAWGETGFRRNVWVTISPSNSDEVLIEVELLWDGDNKSFTIRESMLNLR